MNKTWWEYVQSVTGQATNTEIATKVGIDKSAITRWRKGAGVDPLFAVKFARAYGRPVVEALWRSGLITESEAELREVHVGAESLTDSQLVEEIDRRLSAASTADSEQSMDNVTFADTRFGRRDAPFSAPRSIEEELAGERYVAERTDQGMSELDPDDL